MLAFVLFFYVNQRLMVSYMFCLVYNFSPFLLSERWGEFIGKNKADYEGRCGLTVRSSSATVTGENTRVIPQKTRQTTRWWRGVIALVSLPCFGIMFFVHFAQN